MTPEQLRICTGCRRPSLVTQWLPLLSVAMGFYSIDTPQRQAMFLANVGVESDGLLYTTEIWGPTPTQARYEGRADLGNLQPGDGKRFRGHGLIQTTGRYNHARVRDRLRKRFPDQNVPDFELEPEALALPEWAALSAADYWDDRKCNRWADAGDFDGACDTINRGSKTAKEGDALGFARRLALYKPGLAALSC